MSKINEATDTDLKVIKELTRLGCKRGDTLLYQQEYSLTPEQQKIFEGKNVKQRPEMLVNEQLREQIHDFQQLLIQDL